MNINIVKAMLIFVSTTCVNMCQVKPLESFKGGYHPIILHHNHFKMHVGTQDKPLYTPRYLSMAWVAMISNCHCKHVSFIIGRIKNDELIIFTKTK